MAHRSAFLTLAALVALAACDTAPPVAASPKPVALPAVPSTPGGGSGTKDTPIEVAPGAGVDAPIAASTPRAVTFALAERADLIITWSGAEPSVTGADGITKPCQRTSCRIAVAPPGGYRVEPEGGPLEVTARALALPPAAALAPGAAVELHPAEIRPGDPRGPLADATLHVEAAGLVTLIVRPLAGPPSKDLEVLIKRAKLELYGPAGDPMATTTLADDVPGALELTFDAAPGDYRLRATGVPVEVRAQPLGRSIDRVDTKPLVVAGPDVPLLRVGAVIDVTAQPSPSPVPTWVKLAGGYDLAIEWPTKVALGLESANDDRLCDPSPCIVAHMAGGLVGIEQQQNDTRAALTAHVRLLPPPTVQPGPAIGHDVDVRTAPIGDRDPRRAVAEVAIDFPAAGEYEIIAKDLDWKTPADVMKAPPLAKLDILGYIHREMGGLLVSGADIRAGISRAVVTTTHPARYVVRIDGDGRSAPRRLALRCVKR